MSHQLTFADCEFNGKLNRPRFSRHSVVEHWVIPPKNQGAHK